MLRSVLILVVLLFTFNAFAADRVIVLAPAAADILQKLGSSSQIVGKTKSVEEFPNALKVGSHIRPNLEIIMSLKPDLIIILRIGSLLRLWLMKLECLCWSIIQQLWKEYLMV